MNLQLNLILYMLVMSSVLLAQNSVSLDNGKTEMYGDNGVRTVTISGNNGTGDHEFGQISLSRTLNGTTPAVKAVLTSDVNDGGYLSLADNNSPQNVRVRLYGSATNDTGDHGQLFLSGDSKSSQFFSGFFKPLIHLKNNLSDANWNL